jgi:UDP-glucose 6-dehydrogenase
LTPLRRQSCQADGADALLIVTEWNEFRDPDFEHCAPTASRIIRLAGLT